MSDEFAFAAPRIINNAEDAMLFDHYLVGAHDSSSVELHQSSVSADLSRLHTFRLEAELELDGVTCATLRYSESSALGAAEQTVAGERLDMLLERLRGAYSQETDAEVCAEGSAQITLTYEDGHTIALPLSGDSCTQVRYENVVYDLRTDAERTEHFLNDGGVNLRDILSPLFDQIKFP